MATGGPDLCLVTGASGYIGSHVVQQLLQRGDVRVRGTVRDLKSEKAEKLSKFVPDAKYPLELVEAQLQNADSWIEAVKGCSQVYHIASPLPRQTPQDENELIAPAVDGTLNVLKACAEAGTVKRVVLTSSIAAVSNGLNGDTGRTYTEEDWSSEDKCGSYEKSKLLAEKAAWGFVKKLEDEKKFELAVINPAAVFGPFAFPGDSASVSYIRDILNGKVPALPHVSMPSVDVRDVARAHLAAMEKPEAAGKRFILYNKGIWMRDMAEVISAEFAPMGYKIPLRNFPKFLMWALKWFNAETKMMYQIVDKDFTFNTANAKEILGIETHIELNKTILDTCYDLIEREIVLKTAEYKSRTSSEAAASPSVEEQTVKSTEKSEHAEEAEQTSGEAQQKEAAESTEKAEPESVLSKEQATEEPSEPVPAEQATTEPEPAEPATKEPEPAEPATKEPEPAEPATKEPEPAEQATENSSEPEPVEQDNPSVPAEPVEQKPSEPEPAESKEKTDEDDKEQTTTEQENQ